MSFIDVTEALFGLTMLGQILDYVIVIILLDQVTLPNDDIYITGATIGLIVAFLHSAEMDVA